MFGHNVEPARHLVGVEALQIAVQGESVARQRAAHHRGVGREESGHPRRVLAQVETPGGGHPLVKMRGNGVGGLAEVGHITLYDEPRGMAEQHRFYVVPLAADAVHFVGLPQVLEHVVLFGEQRGEVDQHDEGFALDLPAAHLYAYPLVVHLLTPFAQQFGVFGKFRIVPFTVDVGSYQYVTSVEGAICNESLGGNHGVDTSHLVAHLPTHLEQVIQSGELFVFGLSHVIILCNLVSVPLDAAKVQRKN